MAYPQWLTPQGQLGIVPELEYYQFSLDAYDPNFGNIVYSRVSGVLPEGIQIISTGVLQGIPITTADYGGDTNETFTFTIRARNDQTGNVADRTFSLTITNVAPPIIVPKTVNQNIQLSLQGNITANIGDYLVQPFSTANAVVQTGVTNSSNVVVRYVENSTSYILGSGNLRVVFGNTSTIINAYPISSTVVSSINTRDLGNYFDGTVIDLQLEAVEFANSSVLTWTVTDGEIPAGLSLSTSGLISGYLLPIPSVGPSGDPGWDDTQWDLLGWDFPLGVVSKPYSFTVEVTDGVNYDTVTYSMLVIPRRFFTADSTLITVDATIANGVSLSVDTGARHYPIILSESDSIPVQRERAYLSYQIEAVDIDDDALQFVVPTLDSGTFDEQVLAGNTIPYINSTVTGGNLFTGVFPKTDNIPISTLVVFSGNSITANVGQYITQYGTDANARVEANVINSTTVPITILSANSFSTSTGNISLNGVGLFKSTFTGTWSNTAVVPQSVILGTGSAIDNTRPGLIPGDVIQILDNDPILPTSTWYQATVNNYTNIRVTGNTVVSASPGHWLTQATSGANATISDISDTTGTLDLGGNSLVGTITISEVISANADSYITQTHTGANVRITSNVFLEVTLPISYITGGFEIGAGNLELNGSAIANATFVTQSVSSQPIGLIASAGDIITQSSSGANATILSDTNGSISVAVRFNSGIFDLGSGNITVAGSSVNLYPLAVVSSTDIECQYNSAATFDFNVSGASAFVYINAVNTLAIPTLVNSVGVGIGSVQIQGDIGFDEGRFDQGALALPSGLTIDQDSGWLTGYIPYQSLNEVEYDFTVLVYKRDYAGYETSRQFILRVLGDLNNTINWLTPSYLGTIQNGDISDLFVKAISTRGRTLIYTLTPGSYQRFPQGLRLLSSGEISGRASFTVFTLDQGTTTIDTLTTTFDNTYRFNITASDSDQTVSATREFTIRVIQRNFIPYENLYLKALLSLSQRQTLSSVLDDQDIFPTDSLYRPDDSFYGLAKDIKTLFLPGLNPSTLSHYANAVSTNHFTKRINFNDVKTAVAVGNSYDVEVVATGAIIGTFEDGIGFIPTDFSQGYTVSNTLPAGTRLTNEHIEYEVVYVEVSDDNTNSLGQGPKDTINLTGVINPYYGDSGNAYVIATPNSFENMSNVLINGSNAVGYLDKGVLPDWMTSKQPDGRVIGFTRAVVLAYTNPGESDEIAYRLRKSEFNFNELDFTVDRYQLDNNLSANYDITANAYLVSSETTFDRYPPLSSIYTQAGTVDYALDLAFEDVNQRAVEYIRDLGGLDGLTSFSSGQKLVFYTQEFTTGNLIGSSYNIGWNDVNAVWDGEPWDYDKDTVVTTDDLGWDAASYVPGFNEYNLGTRYSPGSFTFPTNPDNGDIYTFGSIVYGFDASANLWVEASQRIGVWEINIDEDDYVTLEFVQSMNYYDSVYVRNGFTHGGTNIFYDPVVKEGNSVPNYSLIPQQITTTYTTFDGNGTRFLSYRDQYAIPEQGDKYIKFGKNGVFT